MVSYGGKTIPRWRTAAIFKIVISPYLSEKSSDFDEFLYRAADFELDERHVIKNEVALDRLEFDRTYFLLFKKTSKNEYSPALIMTFLHNTYVGRYQVRRL